jgi:hypothetical protein
VVTNHFLHFLTLDRSDPKKFQVLQLIASLLAWDDGRLAFHGDATANRLSDKREQAGLARPGTMKEPSLRVPLTPFRKNSAPSLETEGGMAEQRGSKESLAELWHDFLEREAADGSSVASPRRPSSASVDRPSPQS